jgi:hypothetical protein
MIDRAWVGIGIRFVGLNGLIFSVPTVVSTSGYLWTMIAHSPQYGYDLADQITAGLNALASVAQTMFCAYLLVWPTSVASRWLRSLSGKCPQCLYDIRDLPGNTCPECGGPLRSIGVPPNAQPNPSPSDTHPKA